MSNRYGPRIVTDGLVLCLDAADRNSYPGTGTTWTDLSGNGNNGTLTNGPTYSSNNNGYINFDGSNDYVSINLNQSVQVNSSSSSATVYQWTIMLYYKSNNIFTDPLATSPRHTLFSFNDNTFLANGYNYLDLELWNDDYVLFNGNSTTNQGALAANTRGSNNTGNFNLATMTISGNIITTYHNNILTSRISRSSIYSMSSSYFMLGNRGADNRLNGSISSVYLYNKVLSSSEILQNYNAIKGRFNL